MVAVGYAVMPVIPSFDNISREIDKKISGPLSKASKQAGDALEKGVGAKIDQLGDRAERSAYRQKKAQDELTAATSKRERAVLNEQAAQQKLEAAVNAVGVAQDKASRSVDAALDSYDKLRKSGTASAEELAKAEQKISDARARGQADVERREIAVTNARKGMVSATQGVVDAENGYVRALRESERASEAAETAAKEYADAQERGITAMDRVRDSASRMGSSIAEAAEKYKVHATVALGAIAALGKGAMDYASEAEQSYGAVESIFGAHADAITAKSKEAAEAVGLSGREYRELSSLTGAMLKNMGMPMDEVTGKTQELVAVASDLSATFGGSTKDAIEAVNALLRGEADPIERYGVSIKKTDVNARLAAKGLGDLEGAALKQAEAQELLGMLMEQTADAQGQFARETDTAAHKQQVATAKMNDAREVIGTALLPVMADLMDMGARIAEVIGEHPRLFLAIAGAVGTLAAGVVALGTIAPIFTAVSAAATAAGTSMWGYVAAQTAAIAPIAAVVAGVGVLAAGLTYFFTQTETGRQAWASFTEALAAGWQWLQGVLVAGFEVVRGAFAAVGSALVVAWNAMAAGFQAGWAVVSSVFDAFITAGQWLVTILTTVVLTPLVLAWEALAWAVQGAWVNVIKPTWDALAAGAQWLWSTVLMPTFTLISAGWNALGLGIQWVSDSVIRPVWDALGAAANWLWAGVLQPVFGFISAGWQALGDGLRWVYDSIIQPVWNAFGAGLTWLHDNVVAPVTSWIGDKWSRMGDGFNVVKNFVVDTVFGGFQRGLDTLRGWVGTTADAMGRLWDGIKEKFAKPINFVINFVYNDGIKKVFDAVAEKVGLDARLPAIPNIGNYARGGILPGYTPGRDPYTFVEPRTGMSIGLSGGEAILRPEATRALGPQWVDNINRAARYGGRQGVERTLMQSHFATGGIVHLGNFANGGFTNLAGALSAIQESHAKFVARFFPGMFSLTSASRSEPGSMHDYSRAAATDWQAKDGQYQTQMPTPASKALARAIATNFPTTMQLIHWPEDGWTNLYAGNPHNYGAATNAQHGNHVHWGTNSPLRFDGDDIVLDDVPAAGGGMHFSPLGFFDGLWDRIIGKLPSFDLTGFGDLAQVPGAALKTLGGWVKDWALETLKEWGNKFLNMVGLGKRPASEWSDMAMEALKRMGYGPEHLDAMLKQIQIESGGDPNAVNNWDSNAAKGTPSGGLLQVIEPTYQDVRRRYPEAFEGLPDDRMHPMTNLVAGVGAVKRDWGGPAGRWPTTGGYASGGVLPGFTPGRDIYQLVDPRTGMSVGLSGGEAIMVPEWTRAVGGPAAVAAMNKAARAGRTSGGPGFADGGVFGATGNALTWDGLVSALRDEPWAKAVVETQKQLAKIADYSSVEGMAARSFASEMAGIADMLGGKTVSTVTSSLLDAEKQIWDARAGSADRLAAVAEKERALEEARKAAADAASAEMSEESKKRIADAEEAVKKAREDGDADKVAEAEKKLADVRKEVSEKSAEDVTKANEQVVKAEQELLTARKAAAQALDVRIFDLAPQINGMLLQAAAATVAVPALSGALGGLAAAVGPAGITVGVVLQAVKVGIATVKKVGAAIGDFVTRIIDARGKTYANMVTALNLQHEWAKMVDEQASKVAELRVAWVEAQVALRDATWKTRLAQADVVRAQLQGVKSVAEAEAKLEAERNRAARAALRNFNDLSLAYDRYRWAEHRGIVERLELQAAVTPEILALESEVAAARLNAMAAQKEASLGALQASWEQQKAALALMQTQQNLALQTQQLAMMQFEFFGMSQAESLQAMNTMKLRQELAEVQSQQGKNFWRPSYWLTGAHRADNQRERELKMHIADREGSGAGVDVGGTGGLMAFFGYGDSALNAAKNAGYGRAEQAMFEAQEQQALLQLEQQKQQLQQQIEQQQLFEKYQQQVGALTAEIESLQAGASAAQYTADYYREENTAVKAANLALAQFEADRSSQYAAVGRGEKQVVEITVPQQDVYTREQMDLVLRSVQEIPELEARIRRVEAPATPGANVAMRNLIGG